MAGLALWWIDHPEVEREVRRRRHGAARRRAAAPVDSSRGPAARPAHSRHRQHAALRAPAARDAAPAGTRATASLVTVRSRASATGVYVADPEAIRELFTGDQSDLHAGEANSFLIPIARDALRARARRAGAPAPAQAAAAAVPGLAGDRLSRRRSARSPSARSRAGGRASGS